MKPMPIDPPSSEFAHHVAAVREAAGKRGDQTLLSDCNAATMGDADAMRRVIEAWRRIDSEKTDVGADLTRAMAAAAAGPRTCGCDFCTGKKRWEDNWCSRCGKVQMTPPKWWENEDVCDACEDAVGRELAEERDRDEAKAVREIGERIGYGRTMRLAEKLWREKLAEQGHPGGEHTTGPCAAFMVPCPCPESGRDAAGHCEWCSGTRRVTQRVRAAILAFDLTEAQIDAVYQLALARGDRALLGDVNMARQGEPGARERVAAAYDASRGGGS